MPLKDADAIANSEDPDQTAPLIRLLLEELSDLGLHCLPENLPSLRYRRSYLVLSAKTSHERIYLGVSNCPLNEPCIRGF